MNCLQTPEKKWEAGEVEPTAEISSEPPDWTSLSSRSCRGGAEGGGLSAEQPFIKLSQEEYGEHHSSIMHCRFAYSILHIQLILSNWGTTVYQTHIIAHICKLSLFLKIVPD